MTKADFFRITLKLFGLYMVFQTIISFSSMLGQLAFYGINMTTDGGYWLEILIIYTIIGIAIFFLVFKTDSVIDLFGLRKGFDDERIDIGNINDSVIVKICAILFGGYLIATSFPQIIVDGYLWVKAKGQMEDIDLSDPSAGYNWFVNVLKVILGYLLITTYKSIATFLKIKNSSSDA